MATTATIEPMATTTSRDIVATCVGPGPVSTIGAVTTVVAITTTVVVAISTTIVTIATTPARAEWPVTVWTRRPTTTKGTAPPVTMNTKLGKHGFDLTKLGSQSRRTLVRLRARTTSCSNVTQLHRHRAGA
jgi:hypothetical protein